MDHVSGDGHKGVLYFCTGEIDFFILDIGHGTHLPITAEYPRPLLSPRAALFLSVHSGYHGL
jgi:hypothetical protein